MPLARNVNSSKNISLNEVGSILAINICLVSLFAIGLLYYVMAANAITSSDYEISSLSAELSTINQENSDLITSRIDAEDSNSVLVFAQNNGMVEARTVAHLFENGNVALQR